MVGRLAFVLLSGIEPRVCVHAVHPPGCCVPAAWLPWALAQSWAKGAGQKSREVRLCNYPAWGLGKHHAGLCRPVFSTPGLAG